MINQAKVPLFFSVCVVALSVVIVWNWSFCTLYSQLTLSTSLHSYFKLNLFDFFPPMWSWICSCTVIASSLAHTQDKTDLQRPSQYTIFGPPHDPEPQTTDLVSPPCSWQLRSQELLLKRKKLHSKKLKMFFMSSWSKDLQRLGKEISWCHNNSQYFYKLMTTIIVNQSVECFCV